MQKALSVNQSKPRDACKRASARTINIVIPYFGYARQDRTATSREPITAKLVADMIVKAGADRVLTLDIHAVQTTFAALAKVTPVFKISSIRITFLPASSRILRYSCR